MRNLFNNLVNKSNKIFSSKKSLISVTIGVIVLLAFIIYGAYLGLYVMLGGGAMDIIDVIRGNGGVGHLLVGILKITFSWIGWIFVYLGVLFGALIASN